MNRTLRDSRNIPLHHRRELSFNSKDSAGDDINLDDLFSKSRRSVSLASPDESDALSAKLGRLSIGSVKQGKSGLEDLLSSADGGKNDYDWLLTPPGTPSVPPSNESGNQPGLMARRTGPAGRSISTTKASRLSVSQSEISHTTKLTRSSSVTRPSVSSSQYSTYSNKSASILNTSSASVSSYIRPSTPTRSSSIARPSTPSSRPTLSRSTTPKPRSAQAPSSLDKPRPSQSSRPSTPTSRPKTSTNLCSPAPRISTSSRPSTPTRRNSAPSLSPITGPSTPGGRTISNGRASLSRPSSPGPRVRPTPQPIMLPDFPLETPPNLRTSLPERPISASRSRPSLAATAKGNPEHATNSASTVPRRQSSPVVTRGRLSEPTGRSRTPVKAQLSEALDTRRELLARKPAVKSSSESNGFGRTLSKKSLDMAIRHMDIRSGGNGVRPLTGSNLFPHSIRSNSTQKSQRNGSYTENIDQMNRFSESGSEEERSQSSAKLSNVDVYESSRYDMILLKEDLKNSNWLHSLDDKSDQGPIFDNGLELLPEPFDAI